MQGVQVKLDWCPAMFEFRGLQIFPLIGGMWIAVPNPRITFSTVIALAGD